MRILEYTRKNLDGDYWCPYCELWSDKNETWTRLQDDDITTSHSCSGCDFVLFDATED